MKLTNNQLRQLIKEEIDSVLNEMIPTEIPNAGNMPGPFWTSMRDYLGKWFKNNRNQWQSDNRLRNYLVDLDGKLAQVAKSDEKVNIDNANQALTRLNTQYPDIATELFNGAKEANSALTLGR